MCHSLTVYLYTYVPIIMEHDHVCARTHTHTYTNTYTRKSNKQTDCMKKNYKIMKTLNNPWSKKPWKPGFPVNHEYDYDWQFHRHQVKSFSCPIVATGSGLLLDSFKIFNNHDYTHTLQLKRKTDACMPKRNLRYRVNTCSLHYFLSTETGNCYTHIISILVLISVSIHITNKYSV